MTQPAPTTNRTDPGVLDRRAYRTSRRCVAILRPCAQDGAQDRHEKLRAAVWDHAETEDVLLRRALDATTRAATRPGSIVVAAAEPRHPATPGANAGPGRA
jgi:hypothetical protein